MEILPFTTTLPLWSPFVIIVCDTLVVLNAEGNYYLCDSWLASMGASVTPRQGEEFVDFWVSATVNSSRSVIPADNSVELATKHAVRRIRKCSAAATTTITITVTTSTVFHCFTDRAIICPKSAHFWPPFSCLLHSRWTHWSFWMYLIWQWRDFDSSLDNFDTISKGSRRTHRQTERRRDRQTAL